MSIRNSLGIAGVLALLATAAQSDGIVNSLTPNGVVYDGIYNSKASGGSGCSNALDFSDACNSQYLSLRRF